jgi:two-component system, OmpR family, sensor histidine kinase TctE
MNRSLRKLLLASVLLPLIIAIAVDTWVTYNISLDTATEVQDRLLLGSARMIAEQISYEDGTFQHQIPPAALELFQSQESDRIFYRVTSGDGQLLSGYSNLPPPELNLSNDSPYFFNTTMRGEIVRAVVFYQPVAGNPSSRSAQVEVAQTTRAHGKLANSLWLHAVQQHLLILVLAIVFIVFGLHRGLQPLVRLRNDVRARQEGSLQTLETKNIPTELTPLVDAFNDYMQRLENYTKLRGIFIQNTAHQVRTPIAVLSTQISDALRADNKEVSNAYLLNARKTLQQTTRLVNQFLTLSSAEAEAEMTSILCTSECLGIIKSVLEEMAFQAHLKNIDLGFENIGSDSTISGNPTVFREIVVNLIDNAIRYTPNGGVVTVQIQSGDSGISLVVEDNGPGIPIEEHENVFQRFYRMDGTHSTGSGLGLAIVRELASKCDASVRIDVKDGGVGLLIVVNFQGKLARLARSDPAAP